MKILQNSSVKINEVILQNLRHSPGVKTLEFFVDIGIVNIYGPLIDITPCVNEALSTGIRMEKPLPLTLKSDVAIPAGLIFEALNATDTYVRPDRAALALARILAPIVAAQAKLEILLADTNARFIFATGDFKTTALVPLENVSKYLVPESSTP